MMGVNEGEIARVLAELNLRNARLKEFGFDVVTAIKDVLQVALPLPSKVLEVATGKGRFLCDLASRVSHVITVDRAREEQNIARMQALGKGVANKISFVIADGRALPFRDAQFGSVVSMNTFHHVDEPLPVLLEFLRVTRDNGKIIISDFDECGFDAIERLHRAEGREHTRGGAPLSMLADVLQQHNWSIQWARGHCQEILVALGPAASLS